MASGSGIGHETKVMEPMSMERFTKVEEDLPDLQVGPDGKLTISARPDCDHICMMCPCFMCLGCCCLPGSECLTVEFDDVSRRVKLSRNPGYLLCLKRTDEFSYEEIGNVAFTYRGLNYKIRTYSDVLVLRDGRTFVLKNIDSHRKILRRCAQLHRFIFGRNNPNYIVPETFVIIGRSDDGGGGN